MTHTVTDAVRALCLGLPEAAEKLSHGMANFHVQGKTFATYAVNHHGDGRVALWLEAAPGAQTLHTELEPTHYFVPPYVGPKGWLGVILDSGIGWDAVEKRVREAYASVAPGTLSEQLKRIPTSKPPTDPIPAEEFDPLQTDHAQSVLNRLTVLCETLPETTTTRQFGNPVWKAGKKTFVCVHRYDGRLCIQAWVGGEQQAFLTDDPRYRIPAYVGHNGWIDLDIEDRINWEEVEQLVENSYRHFALKRMLKKLDSE